MDIVSAEQKDEVNDEEISKRYLAVCDEVDEDFFLDNPLPSRSPYRRGADMGRGAACYEQECFAASAAARVHLVYRARLEAP